MLRPLKRLGAALLAFTLLLALSVGQTGAASSSTYYFTSLNDKLLPLTSGTMPVLVRTTRSSTLYVPLSLFDSRSTGVDLGVYCGGDGKPTATLYSRTQSLTFNLDEGTTFSEDGDQKLCMALWRNGRVYVPANWVCNYFGLSCSLLTTDYGDLVRITNGSEALDNEGFIDAAPASMQYRLAEYNKTLAASSPSASISTPAVSTGSPSPDPAEPADPNSLPVALAFRCSEGSDAEVTELLDVLDALGQNALLLFDPARMTEQSALVRRAAASGHTVGFAVESGPAEDVLSALQEGDRLLQAICCARSRVAEVSGASADLLTELGAGGWRCWQGQLDLAGEAGLTSSGLYRSITQLTGPVRVTLAPSASGLLSSLAARLAAGGHTLYTPTESGL